LPVFAGFFRGFYRFFHCPGKDTFCRSKNPTLPPMREAAEWQEIGFDPIATERQLWCNGRWRRQRRNGFFSRKQHNSYCAYAILNEIYVTATAERQLNGGNQA